jgi:hypothetical protein
VLPIVRVPVEMHDGEDKDAVELDAVEHTVREAMYQTATDLVSISGQIFG